MENKIKESFSQIHAERELIEKTKASVLHRKKRRRYAPVMGFAMTVFVIFASYFAYSYLSTETIISYDVNPSVEFNVNKYDRIIGVQAFNEDGKDLIRNVKLKHLNYMDGITKLVDHHPIEEDQRLEITVVSDSEEVSQKYEEEIEHCMPDLKGQIYHLNHHQHIEEAHEHGFSCGKYRAYLHMKEMDETVTEEDAKQMTMQEMHNHCTENNQHHHGHHSHR